MIALDTLPAPRERDLGNGIVCYDNARSIFARDQFLGVEYETGYYTNGGAAAITKHEAFFCPRCGEIWARKIVRAFPLWEPAGWAIREFACNSELLSRDEEALREYPHLLMQAMDAFVFEPGSQCAGAVPRLRPTSVPNAAIHDARAPVAGVAPSDMPNPAYAFLQRNSGPQ